MKRLLYILLLLSSLPLKAQASPLLEGALEEVKSSAVRTLSSTLACGGDCTIIQDGVSCISNATHALCSALPTETNWVYIAGSAAVGGTTVGCIGYCGKKIWEGGIFPRLRSLVQRFRLRRRPALPPLFTPPSLNPNFHIEQAEFKEPLYTLEALLESTPQWQKSPLVDQSLNVLIGHEYALAQSPHKITLRYYFDELSLQTATGINYSPNPSNPHVVDTSLDSSPILGDDLFDPMLRTASSTTQATALLTSFKQSFTALQTGSLFEQQIIKILHQGEQPHGNLKAYLSTLNLELRLLIEGNSDANIPKFLMKLE